MAAWPTERSRHGGADEIPLPETAGRLWLCGKHFVGPDPEAALRSTGADTVVCLCEEFELAERFPDYVAWLRANAPQRAIWSPIADLHAPPLDDAVELLTDIRGRLARGDGLLMHCAAGIGRSGTMAAALLITMGVSSEAAVEHVAAHRPMAGPEQGVQQALLDAIAQRGR
jgi:protein-tyrosine phosphatase